MFNYSYDQQLLLYYCGEIKICLFTTYLRICTYRIDEKCVASYNLLNLNALDWSAKQNKFITNRT